MTDPQTLVFPVEVLPVGVAVGRHRFHNIAEACMAMAGAVSESLDTGPTEYVVESLTLTEEDREACIGLVERYISPGETH